MFFLQLNSALFKVLFRFLIENVFIHHVLSSFFFKFNDVYVYLVDQFDAEVVRAFYVVNVLFGIFFASAKLLLGIFGLQTIGTITL